MIAQRGPQTQGPTESSGGEIDDLNGDYREVVGTKSCGPVLRKACPPKPLGEVVI
jgi:hypothetical protein